MKRGVIRWVELFFLMAEVMQRRQHFMNRIVDFCMYERIDSRVGIVDEGVKRINESMESPIM